MAICPNCLTDIPDDRGVCASCGRARATSGSPSPSVASQPSLDRLDDQPANTILLAPRLPAPLVEPIRAVVVTPSPSPDRTPLPPIPVSASPWSGPGGTQPAREAPGEPPHLTVCGTPAPESTVTGGISAVACTPSPVPTVRPKLVVLRGMKVGWEYPVYDGRNIIGRFADKPVDIDLISQESESQIWSSRQHAAITCDKGLILLEDLNSLNGTWLNGARIHPGQQRPLKAGDVIQIGTVQLKVVLV